MARADVREQIELLAQARGSGSAARSPPASRSGPSTRHGPNGSTPSVSGGKGVPTSANAPAPIGCTSHSIATPVASSTRWAASDDLGTDAVAGDQGHAGRHRAGSLTVGTAVWVRAQPPVYPGCMSEKGLREIIAADTKISDIDGETGRLWYVGYEIGDLAAHASFEETIYLLHKLDLPNRQQLQQLKTFLVRERELHPFLARLMPTLAQNASPMSMLRTGLSRLERLRPRRLGRFPRGRVPQSAPPDRRDPDPDRDLRPTPDGPRGDPAEPRAQPRRQPAVDAPWR